MQHPVARVALCVAMLGGGYAATSSAHQPTAARTCGSFKKYGQPVGTVIERPADVRVGQESLAHLLPLARAVGGSACVRKHFGWECTSAKAFDWPRMGSCTKGTSKIAAFAPAC